MSDIVGPEGLDLAEGTFSIEAKDTCSLLELQTIYDAVYDNDSIDRAGA